MRECRIPDTYYTVDIEGNVKNIKTGNVTKKSLQRYHYVMLHSIGLNRKKRFTVHRLVANAFLPADPTRNYVNHKDGNKVNNHLSNLEWCTLEENMKHAVDTGLMKGRAKRGEKHYKTSLTEKQVLNIRHCMGENRTMVAKYYNVTVTTIRDIQVKKRWGWL